MPGSTEDCIDEGSGDGGKEAIDRRQVGQHGIRHALRYHHDGNCETSQEIRQELLSIVGLDPSIY